MDITCRYMYESNPRDAHIDILWGSRPQSHGNLNKESLFFKGRLSLIEALRDMTDSR